jgi:hypothetical protein
MYFFLQNFAKKQPKKMATTSSKEASKKEVSTTLRFFLN